VLFGFVLVVYLPSLSSSFIWDDDDYVTENRALTSLAGLKQIWLAPSATPQYYPLVFTTFWIEHRLWGLNPAGYHFVNAALHAANAVGVWLILRRLTIPGAWFAAALFGLHPVHVESVAWVTERKNLLSASFYLLALWQFLGWVEQAPVKSAGAVRTHPVRSYVLGFCLFVCALLSKSVTCSLPAVLLFFCGGGKLGAFASAKSVRWFRFSRWAPSWPLTRPGWNEPMLAPRERHFLGHWRSAS
jgi:hypothetical protein